MLVNAARGGIVDEAALYDALKEGRIAAAGLDVFAKEPCTDSPLFELENVVATPHLGASTDEAQEKAGIAVARSVRLALAGELVPDAVNVQGGVIAEDVRPGIPLTEKLGRIFTALAGEVAQQLDVEVRGEITEYDVKVLELAALKGVFCRHRRGPGVLRERAAARGRARHRRTPGHRAREPRPPQPDHDPRHPRRRLAGLGQRHARSASTSRSGWSRSTATTSTSSRPTTSRSSPTRTGPGMVGTVGGILGDAGVNIAGMQVSRDDKGGQALVALSVDSAIPADDPGRDRHVRHRRAVDRCARSTSTDLVASAVRADRTPSRSSIPRVPASRTTPAVGDGRRRSGARRRSRPRPWAATCPRARRRRSAAASSSSSAGTGCRGAGRSARARPRAANDAARGASSTPCRSASVDQRRSRRGLRQLAPQREPAGRARGSSSPEAASASAGDQRVALGRAAARGGQPARRRLAGRQQVQQRELLDAPGRRGPGSPGRGAAGRPAACGARIQPSRRPPQTLLLALPTVTASRAGAPRTARGIGCAVERPAPGGPRRPPAIAPGCGAGAAAYAARCASLISSPVGLWKSGIR